MSPAPRLSRSNVCSSLPDIPQSTDCARHAPGADRVDALRHRTCECDGSPLLCCDQAADAMPFRRVAEWTLRLPHNLCDERQIVVMAEVPRERGGFLLQRRHHLRPDVDQQLEVMNEILHT